MQFSILKICIHSVSSFQRVRSALLPPVSSDSTHGLFSIIQKEAKKMEGEICHYAKFGYCKYKEDCKRKHLKEECDKSITCKNNKTCIKKTS